MFILNNLLRPHIKELKPYASARDEYKGTEGIFLDANENAYGSVTSANYNRYPDPHQRELKQKIASIKKVSSDQIFLGNGSDEAIDLIFRMFCCPGKDNVIIMPPTYGMYEVSAGLNDVLLKKVSLDQSFDIQVQQVLEAIDSNTKIIWICSPNNPTANDLSENRILEILKSFRGIVVIDEAYTDFSERPSYSTYLYQYPNLIILQTFSKAWGLAGLRLGMAYASKEIIEILDKIKPPYNINIVTQKLALEGIENEKWKNEVVEKVIRDKKALIQQLLTLDRVEKIFPSHSNFILVKIKDANEIYNFLVARKIVVRDRSNVKLIEGCLRISIGTPEENEQLVNVIKSFAK